MNKMRYFENLHPLCIFLYFVAVLTLTLACMHPVVTAISLCGALLFYSRLAGWRSVGGMMKFIAPMFLLIALANPLFNHRGVTMLFMLFDQWITLEAICYGFVSAGVLASVILWFSCYQIVMTSDKFLFLFGKIAPSSSLLITLTLRLIPQLRLQLCQIRESQRMLRQESTRLLQKMNIAFRHLSTLLSWSMENAVELADSMKARGYALRRRTTFHLFRFDSRDARVLGLLGALSGTCTLARIFGHGTMGFYPRMDAVITGDSGIVMYALFAALVLLPAIFETKETIRWRSYGLIH
ncbi:energy-coupling factor transporter transmembrane component T [Oscillospiraceae bacterium PP1C4]